MANQIFKSDVNPYRVSIYEHTDRIYNCDDFENDSSTCRELLNNFSEIYVEVGSGSGGHLLEKASSNKSALYLGFEIRFKRAVRTIEKAKKLELDNVYIARINALHLQSFVPHKSLNGVYINFPDPWSKEKQKKNRIFTHDFLDSVHKVLKKEAYLAFKTDHKEYFEYVLEVIKERDDYQLFEHSEDLHSSEYVKNNVKTEFEMLFLSQNLPIYYVKIKAV